MAAFDLKAVITCVDRLSPQLNTMKGKLEKFQRSMNKSGFGKIGLSDAVTGIAISAPFIKGVKDAMAFEDVMADIRKVVDFDTPEQFAQMGKDIRDMSLSLPMAAKDIGAIVAAGGQAGIAKEDLKQFSEDAVKMGIAFDTTAEEAGSTMATWRTALNLTQTEVATLADKINLLGNNNKSSAKEISSVVSSLAPYANQAGVTADKLAALSSTIISTGTDVGKTGTALKTFFTSLSKGKAATDTQKKAFAQLGFDSFKLAKDMQKDAEGTILKVLGAIDKLDKERKIGALNQLFGVGSVDAIAPLLNNLDSLKMNFERVGDASQYVGSMQKEYESRADTTSNKVVLFNNAINNLSITVGTQLLPAFSGLLISMQPIIVSFADFIEKNQWLVTVTASLVGGLIALRLVCAGVNIVVGAMSASMTLFNGVLKGVSLATKLFTALQYSLSVSFKVVRIAMIAFNAVMAANPIGFILTGIAIAATLVIAYWDEISAFFQKLWTVIKPYVMPFFNIFIKPLITLGSVVVSAWSAVIPYFKSIWKTVKPYVMPIFDILISPLKAAGNLIVASWQVVTNLFSGFWDSIKAGFEPFIASFKWLMDAWKWWNGEDDSKSLTLNSDISASKLTMPQNQFSQTAGGQGKVLVEFSNAPEGMNVKQTQSAGGFNLKTNVGYNPYSSFGVY